MIPCFSFNVQNLFSTKVSTFKLDRSSTYIHLDISIFILFPHNIIFQKHVYPQIVLKEISWLSCKKIIQLGFPLLLGENCFCYDNLTYPFFQHRVDCNIFLQKLTLNKILLFFYSKNSKLYGKIWHYFDIILSRCCYFILVLSEKI